MNSKTIRAFCCEIIGIMMLAISGNVLADAETGGRWYVEARLDENSSALESGAFVVDDEQTGWQLGGGYAFNKYFALQANYHDLGKDHFATDCPPPLVCITQNIDRVDVDGYSFSAIGSWPVTTMIDVYGRIGVLWWDTDFAEFPADESGEDLIFGIGAGFALSPKWRLSLQYDASNFDVDSVGIALSYRLGR